MFLLFFVLSIVAVVHARAFYEDEKKPYVKLDGCKFLKDKYHDADSFHVSHNGKEYIFRLYYVDSPEDESHSNLNERIKEQTSHWKVSKEDLFKASEQGRLFTASKLSAPFTVYTRWSDAKGASKLKRYFAHIVFGQKLLAEMLVATGWARVKGWSVDDPSGNDGKKIREKLTSLEKQAKSSKLGIWKYSH